MREKQVVADRADLPGGSFHASRHGSMPRWPRSPRGGTRWIGYAALVCALAGCLSACQSSREQAYLDAWAVYRDVYVSPDGAVLDTGNRGVSHSEGQGYGMLFALAARDRIAFEKLWSWTQRELGQRPDGLHIWRRQPGVDVGKEDHNNATDGDLLIAWALLRADAFWQVPQFKAEALRAISALRDACVKTWRDTPVLLPASSGFETTDAYVVNLSYWIFPALREFAVTDPSGPWAALIESGYSLLDQARFGRWQLWPDWIALKRADSRESIAMPAQFPPRFGYDAVRVPLYTIWDGKPLPRFASVLSFWRHFHGYLPSWLNLLDDSMDSRGAPPGFHDVAELTASALERGNPKFEPIDRENYFSASLQMLSRIAAGWASL